MEFFTGPPSRTRDLLEQSRYSCVFTRHSHRRGILRAEADMYCEDELEHVASIIHDFGELMSNQFASIQRRLCCNPLWRLWVLSWTRAIRGCELRGKSLLRGRWSQAGHFIPSRPLPPQISQSIFRVQQRQGYNNFVPRWFNKPFMDECLRCIGKLCWVIYIIWQCSFCQAYFESKPLLQEHLAEYQASIETSRSK